MIGRVRAPISIGMLTLMLGVPARASADETDNFTCRDWALRDSLDAIDLWMNAKILEAVARANQRGPLACDAACLFRELLARIGQNDRHPLTMIPHASLARWIERQPDIDRCRLKFSESIYGARPYNQPWLFPFTGRIIFLSDSIRLSGRVVGIDKINHFIREGLAHWRAIDRKRGDVDMDIDRVLARELGRPQRPLRMTEYGLKGMALTGVLSYADLAASYSGSRFWTDVLSVDRPASFVARDLASGEFVQTRPFTFAAYVNDAWDESINCSEFHPTLARQVGEALRARSTSCPVTDCTALTGLPRAGLYVSPRCYPSIASATRGRGTTTHRYRNTMAAPIVQ